MSGRHKKLVVALVLLALAIVGGWWLWTRPPFIQIPPRHYPPNNAYEAYTAIAQAMEQNLRSNRRDYVRLIEVERTLSEAPDRLPPADKAFYLRTMRPYLEAYSQYLNLPSVAKYDYGIRAVFSELAAFHRIARAEELLIREALQQGRAYEAVQRAARLMRFSEQIRNEGTLTHYAVGSFIITDAALEPLREHFPRIQDPRALEAIVALARTYEEHRTPLAEAYQHHYYVGLSFYRDLATRKLKARHVRELARVKQLGTPSLEAWLVLAGVGIPFVLRPSLEEYERYHAQLRAELSKPLEQRQPIFFTAKRYLNQLLSFSDSAVFIREPIELAYVRLLGCAAAVRLHQLRTGKYPATLEALNLGGMAIDPFTGKSFVYRTQT
ncbi:MAG: hypothetical protein RMK45_08720, partial [Armatimonadota bacterium]|nr:hypothetical protein [Armatimonadota bacterium]